MPNCVGALEKSDRDRLRRHRLMVTSLHKIASFHTSLYDHFS